MPYEIDQEALDSPNLKMLDINKPPVKSVAHQEYPKMVYLYPKDKTLEHKTRVVKDRAEQDAAEKRGWKLEPHIPEVDEEADLDGFEHDPAEEKRSVGRPKKTDIN